MTPAELLAGTVRRVAGSPLVTHYDDATGERIELSASTLANWVAKTANLLQDEFDVGRGSRVAVVLPVHWQTAAVLLAVWSCGAAVVDVAGEDEGRLDDVSVVVAARDRLAPLEEAGVDPLLGLSLHPLGAGMAGYAGPARDFALEVRAQGDVFFPDEPADPAGDGLLLGRLRLSLGGLTEAAGQLAGRMGLRPEDRVLVDADVAAEAGPVAWLLAPLSAGASIVVCRHADPSRLADRAAREHVTASLGVQVEGVRTLGRG